ncbi:MAG: amylo-alpha-1,6-glucosidase [Lentisphaeria bacterium]
MPLLQQPAPGAKLVRFAGDCLNVQLTLRQPRPGQAFVRSNLGQAAIRRAEIVANVEEHKAILGRDWRDLPMRDDGNGKFSITLPLNDVGVFDLKSFFVPDDGSDTVWCRGDNTRVKIEPSHCVSGNTIYNAFVRQFGKNRSGGAWSQKHRDAEAFLDNDGYTVIPPSGSFADLAQELHFIINTLGFRIIQLLPIHPTPTTFARMGRFGSPFAPLDFFTVDSSMAIFNRHSTPLEQFVELVDSIHAHNALVIIDLPAAHTGWGSTFQVHNPEWFSRNPDGSFQSPGAWGVTWEDLCKMNFNNQALWISLAEVFLHWCRLGVDGFRCDAGYMIPTPVWTYISAKVRQEFPDTIFFLEGLGGPMSSTTQLLQDGGLNWAYSEQFQQFGFDALKNYTRFAINYAEEVGLLVNFAETHDNNRLAATSPTWAALRCMTAALLAPGGGFAIANGVEWLASEKINVHQDASINWGAQENLVELIRSLNQLLLKHPAFDAHASLRLLNRDGSGNALALLRSPAEKSCAPVLVIVNPLEKEHATLQWPVASFDPGKTPVDLLSGNRVQVDKYGDHATLIVPPATAFCLAAAQAEPQQRPSDWQSYRDRVLDFFVDFHGFGNMADVNVDQLAELLWDDPRAFVRQALTDNHYQAVIEWHPEHDERRLVTVPPAHLLYVHHDRPFRISAWRGNSCIQRKSALALKRGGFFVLLQPLNTTREARQDEIIDLKLELFCLRDRPKGTVPCQNLHAQLLLAANGDRQRVDLRLPAEAITPEHTGLCSSELGAYTLARAAWGSIASQYDALLAANLDPKVPVDRVIMLSRCRAWIICRDFSQELTLNCQTLFRASYDNSLHWQFAVPSGMGQTIWVDAVLTLNRHDNVVSIRFSRPPAPDEDDNSLDPTQAVTLVVRPDIEDRSNHHRTKAYTGPEQRFPAAIKATQRHFTFDPGYGHRLQALADLANFHTEPEWSYSVPYPIEKERGLGNSGDLFSPGYFSGELSMATPITLHFRISTTESPALPPPTPAATATFPERPLPLLEALRRSIPHFMTRRDDGHTVIAGYPWFLDWGRDTLICLRGIIAADMFQESRSIIQQFALFEQEGTIPNMIRGNDHSNRDTSDAPLWLFAAVRDYIDRAPEGRDILNLDCGGRSLLAVMESIAQNYWRGIANGIHADRQSALIFSPSHFTWMDTNYPACTPRMGYPIEIQALWINAMDLLASLTGKSTYSQRRDLARESVMTLFVKKDAAGLYDCLNASSGIRACDAQADDACRPNQLFATTLGAISDGAINRSIIDACQPLMLPAAIRSLDDAFVRCPLPLYAPDGSPLNDPKRPYQGHYRGPEDSHRKPAYHNGTGWAWVMPSFCEALVLCYGKNAAPAAKAWLGTAARTMTRGCVGFLPEICDGDAPHTLRGCVAQAWSSTEFFRVLKMVTELT